jgi:hypothetical protein
MRLSIHGTKQSYVPFLQSGHLVFRASPITQNIATALRFWCLVKQQFGDTFVRAVGNIPYSTRTAFAASKPLGLAIWSGFRFRIWRFSFCLLKPLLRAALPAHSLHIITERKRFVARIHHHLSRRLQVVTRGIKAALFLGADAVFDFSRTQLASGPGEGGSS